MAKKARLSKKLNDLLEAFDDAAQACGYREGEAGTKEKYDAAKEALVQTLANLQRGQQYAKNKLKRLAPRGPGEQ